MRHVVRWKENGRRRQWTIELPASGVITLEKNKDGSTRIYWNMGEIHGRPMYVFLPRCTLTTPVTS